MEDYHTFWKIVVSYFSAIMASNQDRQEDSSVSMKFMVKGIKTKFPTVPTVNTETVSQWLKASSGNVVILASAIMT